MAETQLDNRGSTVSLTVLILAVDDVEHQGLELPRLSERVPQHLQMPNTEVCASVRALMVKHRFQGRGWIGYRVSVRVGVRVRYVFTRVRFRI